MGGLLSKVPAIALGVRSSGLNPKDLHILKSTVSNSSYIPASSRLPFAQKVLAFAARLTAR